MCLVERLIDFLAFLLESLKCEQGLIGFTPLNANMFSDLAPHNFKIDIAFPH